MIVLIFYWDNNDKTLMLLKLSSSLELYVRSRSCGLGQFWSLGSLVILNQMGVLRDKIGPLKKNSQLDA